MIDNIQCVLFDHDGTIVDSEVAAMDVALELTNQVMETFGKPHYTKEEVMATVGKTFMDALVDRLAPRNITLTDDFLRFLFLEKERRTIEAIRKSAKPTPGTVKTLKILHQAKIPMAVVSNSTTSRLRASLTTTGLDKIIPFDRVFSAQDSFEDGISRPKPATDIHHLALNKLKQQAVNTIMIEDTPVGVEASVNAGIKTIGYVGASHILSAKRVSLGQELLAKGAVKVIDHMEQLLSIMEPLKSTR